MPFPKSDRIVYGKKILSDVICQFRFPPLLRIDAEVPADIQNKLIEQFPYYREKLEATQQIILSPESVRLKENIDRFPSVIKNHEFYTEDEGWKVNLARNFVSLSTNKYDRWEEFIEKFRFVIENVIDVYKMKYFIRIGLRYVNVIDRALLTIEEKPWAELINPMFLGLLASSFHDNVENTQIVQEILLADNQSVARTATSFAVGVEDKKKSLLIDNDFFFSQKILEVNSLEKLEFLHTRATRLFRYTIATALKQSLI
jgi:uncharacterized protein (TIGR04255 family)